MVLFPMSCATVKTLRYTGILPNASALVQHFGLERLLVTRGAHGYQSFNAQGQCDAEGEGVVVEHLVDTVGAGDTFQAALLTWLEFPDCNMQMKCGLFG